MVETIFNEDEYKPYTEKKYNTFDFYTSTGEFNAKMFNKKFREEQRQRIKEGRDSNLEKLNETVKIRKLHDMSIGEHIFKIQNTFNDIIDDLGTGINLDIFIKDNRLFYIGLFLFLVFVIYLIIYSISAAFVRQNN